MSWVIIDVLYYMSWMNIGNWLASPKIHNLKNIFIRDGIYYVGIYLLRLGYVCCQWAVSRYAGCMKAMVFKK